MAETTTSKVKTEETSDKKKYSKARILKDGTFESYRDILEVVLSDSKSYTLAEVEGEINKFLKRKVN